MSGFRAMKRRIQDWWWREDVPTLIAVLGILAVVVGALLFGDPFAEGAPK